MGLDPRPIGIWRPFTYCAFEALILGLQMFQKQFWDLTTGKSAVQTLVQIAYLYVVKKERFA